MEITAPGISRPLPAAAAVQPRVTTRLHFVDNIRVLLTVLVLLHHLMIIYAGTGNFTYTEGRQDFITKSLGGWFCSVDQAYFMGLFLLISAYFVPGSYDRKGPGRFVIDRLIRLGIPLAVYSWVIDPLFIYAGLALTEGPQPPLWRFFLGGYFGKHGPFIGAGPLWFVETLLIFTLLYVVWRLIWPAPPAQRSAETPFPSDRAIALFALLLGLAAFVVRLRFTVDAYNFRPLNLQLPFFVQYVVLFVVGLVAYRRNWLLGLPESTGQRWLRIAGLLILLWAPMMLLGGATSNDMTFKGGWHWQAFAYALWEAFTCVAMCISVIYLFRRYANGRGGLSRFLVPNAYTAYIIHAPVITTLAFAVRDVTIYPLLKWALVSMVAVPLCFGLSSLIRRLPGTDRVL